MIDLKKKMEDLCLAIAFGREFNKMVAEFVLQGITVKFSPDPGGREYLIEVRLEIMDGERFYIKNLVDSELILGRQNEE